MSLLFWRASSIEPFSVNTTGAELAGADCGASWDLTTGAPIATHMAAIVDHRFQLIIPPAGFFQWLFRCVERQQVAIRSATTQSAASWLPDSQAAIRRIILSSRKQETPTPRSSGIWAPASFPAITAARIQGSQPR